MVFRYTIAGWQALVASTFVTGIAVLTALEWFFWEQGRAHPSLVKHYFPPYHVRDSILGSRELRGVRVRAIATVGARKIYSVTYTLNEAGMRTTPTVPNPSACVVFLGDSFTFGEGLNDDETVPARVARLANAQTYNFGFQSYGAAQQLAMLETGVVSSVLRCRPTHVLYMAISDHVARSAGLGIWRAYGPRYVQTDSGVRFSGLYGSPPSQNPIVVRVREQFGKSALYRWIAARTPNPSDRDYRLYEAIVRQIRRRTTELFPGAEFHVLLWPVLWPGEPPELQQRVFASLVSVCPSAHSLEPVLPDFRLRDGRYWHDASDHHPNAFATGLVSEYIAEAILRNHSGSEGPRERPHCSRATVPGALAAGDGR